MTNLGSNFYPKLVQVASELNMKPEDILAIMVSESGINPGAVENKYHGSGLIGFMPDTLKNLGYQGGWQDFSKTSGEQQLDYVKKYIQSKIAFNGGPFTSAAQYYVANFYPVALKLPGIKAGDPDTVFLEENPKTVKDKNGNVYSKKYYDIGYKISPRSEAEAYRANPLFHGKTQGAITYGDMMHQVDKNRQGGLYNQSIAAMKNSTGYQAAQHAPQMIANKSRSSGLSGLLDKLQNLLHQFSFASAQQNNFLVSVGSSGDYATTVEYARILSAALTEYLQADTQICTDPHNIEIECKISGDKKIIVNAIKELANGVSDAFHTATQPIGNKTAFIVVFTNFKSEYQPLHPRQADRYSRMFKLQFVRQK